MVYHGHIKNGRVILDDAARLPEGSRVRIEVVDRLRESDNVAEDGSIWDRLRELSESVDDLPEDLAARHDHYRRQRHSL